MKKDDQKSQIVIYQTPSGENKIEVRFDRETVWLSQKDMAELFDKDRKTVTEHIQNIFKEGELVENSVCREFQHTAEDGKIYDVNFYNLDVIISVGYRVNSVQGTQFRQWATARLREYLVQGFTMNDEFLKNNGGGVYFKNKFFKIVQNKLHYAVHKQTASEVIYNRADSISRLSMACSVIMAKEFWMVRVYMAMIKYR